MSNLSDLNFNANEIEPVSFDVVPAGDYDACIVDSEVKTTSDGAGKYLKLEFQILSGSYQNRKIWENLNIWNNSEKAVQIAKGSLSAICRAVGVLTPKDSCELHNKPMVIGVKVEKSPGFNDQNRIKSYKPRNSGPAAPPASEFSQPVGPDNAPDITQEPAPWSP